VAIWLTNATLFKVNRICDEGEGDLDLTFEENRESKYPKLTLAGKIHHTGYALLLFSQELKEGRSEKSEDGGDCLKIDSREEMPSSSISFKTISGFRLLCEEEEKLLGKQIKECEEEFKCLVIKWKHLFKNTFLKIFFAKDKEKIHKELRLINDSLQLFDGLAELEKKRRKVESALQEQNHNKKTQDKLQEALYKVEAEIAKFITKITLSKAHINRTVYNLKNLAHKKHYANKRRSIENDLRGILEGINSLSKEIKKLKSELAYANQKLVTRIAQKYSHYGLALPDLIQEGNLGLLRAIDTFDYRRGYRFMTYATWWIRQGIVRALQNQLMTIRKPNHMSEKLSKIAKASNRLLQEYKREPTLEEVAEEMNVTSGFIEEIAHGFKDTVSMDALIEEGRESESTLSFCHTRNPMLERVVLSSLSQVIHVALSELSPRESEVVKLRFGIAGYDHHTLEEIGERFDFTRERSRQILESALNKIKNSKHIIQLEEFKNIN